MKHFRVQFQYTFPYVVSHAALILTCLWTSTGFATNVVLNGRDISNARNQEMKNVNVLINERGDIFITGPYQVIEEQTFVPISAVGTKAQAPAHQAPKEILSAMKEKPKEAVDAPVKSGQAADDANKIQQPAASAPVNAAPGPQANAPGSNPEKPGTR